MLRFQKICFLSFVVLLFTACTKNGDPIIVVPPLEGAEITFNGLVATENGSLAGKSSYLDLSTKDTITIQRSGWELAFYCSNEFRVALNNTVGTGAKVLDKTDINAVSETDTIGLNIGKLSFTVDPAVFQYFDNLDGSVTGTVIPEVSATDANNKVIIINRGIGGGIAARPWVKIRILRNGTNGYTLQYAPIKATTFTTVNIAKDAKYHFKLVSLDSTSALVKGQPEKAKWDLVWSYSLYKTVDPATGATGPYFYSDMIAVNHLSNVQVKEKIYADEATAKAAYAAFNSDSIAVAANTVVSGRWTIADNWREVPKPGVPSPRGALKDRFYIIKDTDGNYYKFKCKAMGSTNSSGGSVDGGTRGKPEFEYKLVRKA